MSDAKTRRRPSGDQIGANSEPAADVTRVSVPRRSGRRRAHPWRSSGILASADGEPFAVGRQANGFIPGHRATTPFGAGTIDPHELRGAVAGVIGQHAVRRNREAGDSYGAEVVDISATGDASPSRRPARSSKRCASSVRSRTYITWPGDAYTSREFAWVRKVLSGELSDPKYTRLPFGS